MDKKILTGIFIVSILLPKGSRGFYGVTCNHCITTEFVVENIPSLSFADVKALPYEEMPIHACFLHIASV